MASSLCVSMACKVDGLSASHIGSPPCLNLIVLGVLSVDLYSHGSGIWYCLLMVFDYLVCIFVFFFFIMLSLSVRARGLQLFSVV